VERVRMPGENALARRRAAMRDGVELSEPIVAALRTRATHAGTELPPALE
jgi:LDH2 family malate/lactate/ureidoglycolate dehydrogenase